MSQHITFIPRVTINTNSISIYKEIHRDKPFSRHQENDDSKPLVSDQFLNSQRKANGFLSKQARKKLFKAIDYLVITSDKKKIYSKLQQKYITYRIVFVTLTLPSQQLHSDKEITNTCFNQLLIELSKYHNVKRYVWRAEKQENGNIHYHLLINQFIEYQELRKRWNRICNKLGYVDRYQHNMKEYFKNGFRLSNNENDKRTIEQQRKAYIIGQKSDWTSPNSTDIHNTRKISNIRKYVAKYMAKQPDIDLTTITDIENLNIVNCRLWSCSHDLSNITGCQLVEDWEISDELEKVVTNSKCKQFVDTYFTILYVDATQLFKYGSKILYRYFADYLINTFNFNLSTSLTL